MKSEPFVVIGENTYISEAFLKDAGISVAKIESQTKPKVEIEICDVDGRVRVIINKG